MFEGLSQTQSSGSKNERPRRNCRVLTNSANPVGTPGTGMAPQVCPSLGHNAVVECDLFMERSHFGPEAPDFTPSSCSYPWVPPFCGPLQSVCLFLKSFLTLCRQEISYTFSLCSPFSFQAATENLEGDHKIAGDPGQDIAWVSGFWLSKPGDR